MKFVLSKHNGLANNAVLNAIRSNASVGATAAKVRLIAPQMHDSGIDTRRSTEVYDEACMRSGIDCGASYESLAWILPESILHASEPWPFTSPDLDQVSMVV